MVKNLPAIEETRIGFLSWEDLLEKGMATHFSILAWRVSWTEEPGRLQFMGSQRVEHNWATKHSTAQSTAKSSIHPTKTLRDLVLRMSVAWFSRDHHSVFQITPASVWSLNNDMLPSLLGLLCLKYFPPLHLCLINLYLSFWSQLDCHFSRKAFHYHFPAY